MRSARLGAAWLLLLAAWLYAPDLALWLDVDPSATTYRANGLCGAALAAALADGYLRPRQRAAVLPGVVMIMAALLWAAQFACDWWYTPGAPTASVCDDTTGRPLTLVSCCVVLAVAAAADIWMTRMRDDDSS